MDVVDCQPGKLGTNAPGSQPVNGVTIRCLTDTPEDAKFAGALAIEAFRGKTEYLVTKAKVPTVIELARTFYQGQDPAFYNRILIAEHEGKRAGVIQLKYHDSTEKRPGGMCPLGCWSTCRFICFECRLGQSVGANKCYIDHIAVDDGMRGKGVGRLLLDRAEYEAKQRNCTCIFLWVTADNRAKSLYERQGYAYTDTKSCCVGCVTGPPGKVFVMEKKLSE